MSDVHGIAVRRTGAPLWVFAIVLAVAVVMRFWNIDRAGISHWDAGTYTAGPLGIGPYARGDLVMFQTPPLVPGLFALVFAVWEPYDTLAIGLVALLGVATVVATFLAGRRWVGDAAALAGAAALAAMEFHLLFSRQALTDAPFALLLLLAAWTFTTAVRLRSVPLALLAGVVSGAAILTKYHGALALGIPAIWLVARRAFGHPSADESTRRGWGLWLVAAAVAAAPAIWLSFEIDRTIGLSEFRASRREWLNVPGLYLLPMTGKLVARSLLEWVSPFVLVPAAIGFAVMLRRRTSGDLIVCALAATLLAALPFYRFYPRLLVPALVPIALAAGVGLDALAAKWAPLWTAGRTAVLALLVLAPSAWAARGRLALEDRGYELAARFLSGGAEDERPDVLVTQHAILFYLRERAHPFVCYEQPEAVEALTTGRFRYLVGDLRLIHAPDFRAFLERRRADLKLVAEIGNPLPPSTVVNTAGFDGLDALRSSATSAEDRATLERIRVWKLVERSPR